VVKRDNKGNPMAQKMDFQLPTISHKSVEISHGTLPKTIE